MHKYLRLIAPLPLLLAAAPAPPLMPGLWEQTLVTVLDTVNGSADVAAHMQGALPKPAPRRDCYTAADLADPRTILMDMGDGRCSFSRFTMIDGRIAAAGDCAAGGETMHVEGGGTYTATVMISPSPAQAMPARSTSASAGATAGGGSPNARCRRAENPHRSH